MSWVQEPQGLRARILPGSHSLLGDILARPPRAFYTASSSTGADTHQARCQYKVDLGLTNIDQLISLSGVAVWCT